METLMLLAVPTLGLLSVAFLGYRTLKQTASMPRADAPREVALKDESRDADAPRPARVKIYQTISVSRHFKHRPRAETKAALKIHAAE